MLLLLSACSRHGTTTLTNLPPLKSRHPKPWIWLAFGIAGALQLVAFATHWTSSPPGSVPLWQGLLRTALYVAMMMLGVRSWVVFRRLVASERLAAVNEDKPQGPPGQASPPAPPPKAKPGEPERGGV